MKAHNLLSLHLKVIFHYRTLAISLWRRNAKTAELMGTIGVTLNRGKTEMAKGAISQTPDFCGKFFHSERTTKTVAAEKYNPPTLILPSAPTHTNTLCPSTHATKRERLKH